MKRRHVLVTTALVSSLAFTSTAQAVSVSAGPKPARSVSSTVSTGSEIRKQSKAPRATRLTRNRQATSVVKRPTASAAVRMYGTPASGLAWHSGFYSGGYMSGDRVLSAAAWRGNAMDFATMYPAYDTWEQLRNSEWHIATYHSFPGRLSYGLPMLPRDRRGQWNDILSGEQDETFRQIARQLVRNGRGTTAVRVGLEANGNWFPWSVTAETAPQYKAAFRRIVTVMRAEAPQLTFWFDLNAGTGLHGQTGRLDVLTKLYPGDDVVHGISMDHYDAWQLGARTDTEWAAALRPSTGAGLLDGVEFARKKGKGFAVPEWGLHGTEGNGDNPYFIRKMREFFSANRDVVVFEAYFNEGDDYIRSALWEFDQNPLSAAEYRKLFSKP